MLDVSGEGVLAPCSGVCERVVVPEYCLSSAPWVSHSDAMSKDVGSITTELLSILDLERLEDNLFRGVSLWEGWQRVYGGQVLAQALTAAIRTVEPARQVHSLHSYFLLAGDPQHPIIYDVERLREGGSFSTRRVKAIQHGAVIFIMSASFHKAEDGFEHAAEMPDVPGPEKLLSASELVADRINEIPDSMRDYWSRPQPFDMRPVDISRYLNQTARPPQQSIWIKSTEALPEDPAAHQVVLAYASDFTLLDTALIAHGKTLFDTDVQLASLDHALWFHRPLRADEWLLYVQDSPNASGARGFCRGQVFTREGVLVASSAQEGLMRRRSTNFSIR
ncbi:acyl-CoA thioesterase II [Candidatus Filomicrobium marinum]|uniref:Acyl-CoA thioesterase 2 n=2 Tax=Candidatus Filomicrobium marinum TaxID=1608628 RepID=A0A0D6JCK2_9HYPH|nr:acyl-CoA thioesterase II [Candidatus Filomicrobium marinum]CPR16955.1 acyl-CoA thioesterase II [Candidatus Filomicrobium marinum]